MTAKKKPSTQKKEENTKKQIKETVKKTTKKESKNQQSEEKVHTSKDEIKQEVDDEKISKKTDKEKKKDFQFFIILIAVLGLAIAGIYGIGLLMKEKPIEIESDIRYYKGYTFENKAGIWFADIQVDEQVFELAMYYPPDETENISNSIGPMNPIMSSSSFFVTIEPGLNSQSVIAGVEISKILGKIFEKQVKAGMSEGGPESEIGVYDCRNATSETTVIWLKKGNETRIFAEEDNPYCIKIEAENEQELIRAADRFSYGLLKMMD